MTPGPGNRLFRPTIWLTVERAFSEAFFLLLFAVQAPLLGPAAFGLVSAAMVFVAFWEGVPGSAMTEALLSIREIDDRHFSSVTTASAVLCLLFGAIVVVFAKPLAAAFGNAELASIMRVMAVLPLIHAFSIAPLAAAQREMRFQSTALRTVASLIAGAAIGLFLTVKGAGAWALVWQTIAQRAVATCVLWAAVPLKFQLGFSPRHFREVGVFVLPVTMSRLAGWASGQLPRLILGLYLGPADLGLFTLASRLNAIVHQVVLYPKAFVARVDLRRFVDMPGALAPAVRQMFTHLGVLTFPVCFGGAAIVPTLFHAWLDRRWDGATTPSQLLLLACAPYVTFYGSTSVLYALNLQSREVGFATVVSLGGLAAPLLGGPFGLVQTSVIIAVLALAAVPLPIVVLLQTTGLSLRDILLPQVGPFFAAGVMGSAVSMLGSRLSSYPPIALLCLQVGLGAVCYISILGLLHLGSLVQQVPAEFGANGAQRLRDGDWLGGFDRLWRRAQRQKEARETTHMGEGDDFGDITALGTADGLAPISLSCRSTDRGPQ